MRLPGAVVASVVVCAIACVGQVASMGGMEQYSVGHEVGFGSRSRVSDITPAHVDRVRKQAHQGSAESQYFLGLLLYYGEGMIRDQTEAARFFRKAAEQGHVEAATNLAVMYAQGEGVAKNPTTAVGWLRRGANENNADAQWLLGEMIYSGEAGVLDEYGDPDYMEAAKWFGLAADASHPRAQFQMGVLNEYGVGVVKNSKEARRWYSACAKADVECQYHLGLSHAYGRGGPQDFAAAAESFMASAMQSNHGPSCYYLGIMSLYGHGLEVDYDLALTWFQRAVDDGDPRTLDKARAAVDEVGTLLALAKADIKKKLEGRTADLGRPVKGKPRVVEKDPELVERNARLSRALGDAQARKRAESKPAVAHSEL